MNSHPIHPVPGPSNTRSTSPSSPPTPHFFFPPSVTPHTFPAHLSSTQDLLSRFHLLPAYDKYVRPFAVPVQHGADQTLSNSSLSGSLDKGKGKVLADTSFAPSLVTGGDGDDDEVGARGNKKRKDNYKYLVKEIPGKHSFRKDEYLSTIMQIPPKQRVPIQPFDTKTQEEAFSVSLEALKGWNTSALILESPQAREERKKRKEIKRRQKSQHQSQAQRISSSHVLQQTIAQTPFAVSPAARARSASTAITQRFNSINSLTGSVSRMGSSTLNPTPPTIAPEIPATSANKDKRGVKRDREDINMSLNVTTVGSATANGNNANPAKATVNAKAGALGVRPRPLKKQKLDIPGQVRNVSSTQQLTPQDA